MHSAMIALVLPFLAFTSASPLQARACLPNFGGPPGVSIINNANNAEWATKGLPAATVSVVTGSITSAPEFRVEFTGQPNNDFLIKPINFSDLRVAAVSGGLQIANANSADRAQEWLISCGSCNPPAAQACTIQSATTGQCVQVVGSSLALQSCSSSPDQLFDIK